MSEFDLSQGGAPTSDAGPSAPSTPSAAPAAPSGAPIGATAPSEPTFEVTVNGKVEKVPLSELQKGYSRTQDYTQKTQRLAAERQQILNQVAEYEAALREVQSFLSDRDRVFQYARSMGASQQQAAAIADQASQGSGNPEDILTRQDAQRLVQEMLQNAAPQLVGPAHQQMQALRLEMATREYQQVFDQKIAQLQQAHPELGRLGARGAQMIRMEALQQRPQSVESALEALELAAETLVADFSNVLKQEAVAPSNPLKQGIEPPGGTGILPAPQGNFKSIRDPRLREQVINDLNQMGLFTGQK